MFFFSKSLSDMEPILWIDQYLRDFSNKNPEVSDRAEYNGEFTIGLDCVVF